MRRTIDARTSVLQVYLAQSLYKAGMYPEATRAAVRVDSPQYQQRMIALQVCAERNAMFVWPPVVEVYIASCRPLTHDVERLSFPTKKGLEEAERSRKRGGAIKVCSDWICTSTCCCYIYLVDSDYP